MKQRIQTLCDALRGGRPAVTAVVTACRGATPRAPGALLVLTPTTAAGTVGGGILANGKGIQIFPAEYAVKMLTLPVGGFLVLGCLIAAMQWALSRNKK